MCLLRNDGVMGEIDSDWWAAQRQLLASLATDARELAGSSAAVVESVDAFHVKPSNPKALGIWVALDQWLVIEAGHPGGRWELRYEDRNEMRLAREIIKAVILGHVNERFGLARSLVTVALEDGSTSSEVGYSGFWAILPQPGWKRRVPQRNYEAYR